jgi:hypothetical protein
MSNPSPMTTPQNLEGVIELETALFDFLNGRWIQEPHPEMDLQYMEAETHDLARELARFVIERLSSDTRND